jgi:hypothetical protein
LAVEIALGKPGVGSFAEDRYNYEPVLPVTCMAEREKGLCERK